MPVNQAAKATRPPASSALLSLMLEFLAVGTFTLMAGASSDVGTIMVIMMVGFWLIYMVTNAKVIASLGNALAVLSGNPSNKK